MGLKAGGSGKSVDQGRLWFCYRSPTRTVRRSPTRIVCRDDRFAVVQVQNDNKPLWLRSPKEVQKDEYDAFFKNTFRRVPPPPLLLLLPLPLLLLLLPLLLPLLLLLPPPPSLRALPPPSPRLLHRRLKARSRGVCASATRSAAAGAGHACCSGCVYSAPSCSPPPHWSVCPPVPPPPPPPPPPCREFVEPLGVAHFNVEGTIEFSSMLFVPGMAPFDQNQGPAKSRNIRLYVKRVFISGACLAWWLAPGWVVVLNTFVEHIC